MNKQRAIELLAHAYWYCVSHSWSPRDSYDNASLVLIEKFVAIGGKNSIQYLQDERGR